MTSLPVISLGEQIQLKFDDLNADDSVYYYTIERFDAEWKKSDLFRSDFMQGYDDLRIQDTAYSLGTLQPYIHYSLKIPNDKTKLTKSGNYKLNIWDNKKNLVIQKKFMIVDEKTTVAVSIKRSQQMKNIQTKQSVQFIVDLKGLDVRQPETQIKPFIVQNQRLKSWRYVGSPTYIFNTKLEFNFKPETLFDGGNEYFFFDTQEIRSSGGNVSYVLRNKLFNSILNTNWIRSGRPYTYLPDINGDFRINTFNGSNAHTESDYSKVTFSLFPEDFLFDGEHYVVGDFNQHIKNEQSKLSFNSETSKFEKTILLKQGIYNYKFYSTDKKGIAYNNLISGNYWATENSYRILIYYRPIGARCDQLIAVGNSNSVNIDL
jgi:hypothetical protein